MPTSMKEYYDFERSKIRNQKSLEYSNKPKDEEYNELLSFIRCRNLFYSISIDNVEDYERKISIEENGLQDSLLRMHIHYQPNNVPSGATRRVLINARDIYWSPGTIAEQYKEYTSNCQIKYLYNIRSLLKLSVTSLITRDNCVKAIEIIKEKHIDNSGNIRELRIK